MTTLLEIRNRCKQESDLVNSEFIAVTEWDSYINGSYAEAYGLYAQAYGADYFVATPFTFTTNGTSQFFSLPADFWKLLGVDVQVSSPQQWVSLKPFAFGDRNNISLYNQQVPSAGQHLRVWYIPAYVPLVQDGDAVATALSANDGVEYIVADVCIKALGKEESDVSVFMARKQALTARLEAEVANRDAGNPARIVNVIGRRSQAMQYRIQNQQLWLIGGATPGYWPLGDWGPASDADDFGGYW